MIFRRLLKPVTAPQTPEQPTDATDTNIDVLARTIWGEARGESVQGMEAVANVIMNRLAMSRKRGRFWWGNSIETICKKPQQFSCWNNNDPNYKKLQSLTDSDSVFALCKRIARRAAMNTLPDHTNGADHYHADYVTPSWARSDRISATIGRHIFYRLEQ